MSISLTQTCGTRGRLYNEHEKLALKRIAHGNGSFKVMDAAKLKKISRRMADVLEELREHEQIHQCS